MQPSGTRLFKFASLQHQSGGNTQVCASRTHSKLFLALLSVRRSQFIEALQRIADTSVRSGVSLFTKVPLHGLVGEVRVGCAAACLFVYSRQVGEGSPRTDHNSRRDDGVSRAASFPTHPGHKEPPLCCSAGFPVRLRLECPRMTRAERQPQKTKPRCLF